MKCGYCQRQANHNKRTCPVKKLDAEMFRVHRFPQKFTPGQLVRFVAAPPRWDGERPRRTHQDGALACILSDPTPDSHSWGGAYEVVALSGDSTGVTFYAWGDFLRPE